jgi:TatD DNase family protein
MMHCFSGNFALATEYANLGFMISIPGTVTYPKNTALREVVSLISLDKLLIETDIPYLTPVPNRGKRNETAYINFTLDEIVRIRSEKKEYVAKNIFENTKKLFNLEI